MIHAASFDRLFAAVAAVGRRDTGWTRAPWSDELRAAEAVVIAAADEAGLEPAHDAAGNLWLTDRAAPAKGLIAAGSHLDTVPDGGAYDGALGVVAAIVAVGTLRAAQLPGVERLAVVSFADEEGFRFGTPIYGSRVLTGAYGPEILDRVDATGASLRNVAPSDPFAARGGHERLAAFVEVHIEQGRALAALGRQLGIATTLAARRRYEFAIDGRANHAGTTPMDARDDALVHAARIVLACDAAARAVPDTVATVGRLTVEPGGANVIPGRCVGTLDVRAPTAGGVDDVLALLRGAHPDLELVEQARDDGIAFSPHVRAAIAAAAHELGVETASLASFAGHDAGVLQAAGVPAAMLFVRSPDGVSHHPAERADRDDCLAATDVLARTLAALLGESTPTCD